VAPRASCNQVLFSVIAGLASEFNVMDVQLPGTSTKLTSPVIALQYLTM
jgi:hypothetical protein